MPKFTVDGETFEQRISRAHNEELRDEFAMAALVRVERKQSPAEVAIDAYKIADAMLKERSK